MNKFTYFLLAVSLVFFASCSANKPTPAENDQSLQSQLEELTPATDVPFSELQGDSNSEKLLYLLDVPTMLKSTTLIFLDTQIESFETVGNQKEADVLKDNRKMLMQALDETMLEYIAGAAKAYEVIFTAEEIEELVQIYQRPVMNKMIQNQLEIQKSMIPIAEEWGEILGIRYKEILATQDAK